MARSLPTRGTALITGASSGIGALYAHGLARRGYNLILVARKAERLRGFAGWLRTNSGRSVAILAADLTEQSGIASLEDHLSRDASLTLLVNNAGAGVADPVPSPDMGSVEAMIALNMGVPARLAYAAAVAFSARRFGTIVNIASAIATAPGWVREAGDGGKAFLVGLSETLDAELRLEGVRTQVVLPEARAGSLWELAGSSIERLPREVVLLAEEMVEQALTGLDAGEKISRPTLVRFRDWDGVEPAAAGSFAFR